MPFSTYNSFVTGFTGAQFILPLKPAVFSWTVTVQSGAAYVNGFPVVAGNQIKWGGYDTATLAGANTVVIGCTGGNTIVSWDTTTIR